MPSFGNGKGKVFSVEKMYFMSISGGNARENEEENSALILTTAKNVGMIYLLKRIEITN